jgi:hypothetical protein
MAIQTARSACIYCGGHVGRVKQGEHIIPAAVHGALTIKTVCGNCNNAFSQIDTELCSRSPLSIVASQQIDAHLWQIWDVDHGNRNLLLEARPDWTDRSLTLYPQMVFEQGGPQIRGDHEEMLAFGRGSFQCVLIKSLLRAFRRYKAGQGRWLHLERIQEAATRIGGYRLPPRIFTRRSIQELADRMLQDKRAAFVLRYQRETDRRFALNAELTIDCFIETLRRHSFAPVGDSRW